LWNRGAGGFPLLDFGMYRLPCRRYCPDGCVLEGRRDARHEDGAPGGIFWGGMRTAHHDLSSTRGREPSLLLRDFQLRILRGPVSAVVYGIWNDKPARDRRRGLRTSTETAGNGSRAGLGLHRQLHDQEIVGARHGVPCCGHGKAVLYRDGITALPRDGQSDSYYSAGHAIRFFMHDLLTLFDLPTLGSLPQLSNRIRDLDPIWEVTTKSSCRIDGGWKGEIDALLAKLLGALEELFSWRRDQLPKKHQIIEEVFRQSDPKRWLKFSLVR